MCAPAIVARNGITKSWHLIRTADDSSETHSFWPKSLHLLTAARAFTFHFGQSSSTHAHNRLTQARPNAATANEITLAGHLFIKKRFWLRRLLIKTTLFLLLASSVRWPTHANICWTEYSSFSFSSCPRIERAQLVANQAAAARAALRFSCCSCCCWLAS